MPVLHHEERPWGHFDWIFDSRTVCQPGVLNQKKINQTCGVCAIDGQSGANSVGFIIKSLFVLPGKRLSDQRHQHRKESWFVQSGIATVYLEHANGANSAGLTNHANGAKETITLHAGQMIEFPELTWHRLSAENSREPVIITEVWCGIILDENDIERRSDDYGRV